MPEWLSTTITLLAGGALTILAGWLADQRASERERVRRQDERRERLLVRRNDFQRETLLALQDATQRLIRSAGAMHFQDVSAYRTSGKWQRQQFNDDLSDQQLRANTDTMLFASRVRDDEVRNLADQLRDQVYDVGSSPDEATAEGRMLAAANTQQALIQRIGQLVRELDDDTL
ncbi:MAG: hypothetical protein DCC69_06565 [Hyphomicrobiales bacterium]|nr:MAG: hypothetical protein DCC69_06565 [Hyphomicrobiales bacterium]